MKNPAKKILFLLLLSCSSCASVYRFSVDIQEPASITLPLSAQNVLILNNTVKQPGSYGIDRTFDGQSIRTDYPLMLDSMVWSAANEIAVVLEESGFFRKIAIYRVPLRTDSEWLTKNVLSSDLQSDFYNIDDFDALLVIDRLLFSVKENVKKIETGSFTSEPNAFIDLRVDGLLTCSMYTYEKEKPLTMFTIADSLFVKSTVPNDSIFLLKTYPEYLLNELSFTLGNQTAKHFIPTWITSERLLFTGNNPRMKEAAGYAANHQWAHAESIWTIELAKKTKPIDQAKIAFNLAIANEMQDKFESALEWAKKANEYLKTGNPENYSEEIELTDQYILELERRIQNNRLLDLQWGNNE